MRFALFRETDESDEDDGSDEEAYLGCCAPVEGLFVDQSPPEREAERLGLASRP